MPPLTLETLNAGLTIVILVATVVGFVREKLPPDVTALLAILALLVTGVLDPVEAFSGFSHPATISVAAVLVLSAGLEKTGALTFVARRVLGPIGRSELLLTVALMVVIGTLSAFINNTAAVAVFIPVVLEVCRRTGARPGRLLMPMSLAATMGGMCTLIGTSTNLVTHEFAVYSGLSGFSMFELGKVGLPFLIAGFAYILLGGRWLLPAGPSTEPAAPERIGHYLSELVVPEDSEWVGKELDPKQLAHDHDVELLSLVRGEAPVRKFAPPPVLQADDRLRIRGRLESLLSLAGKGLRIHRPGGAAPPAAEPAGKAAPPAEREAAAGSPDARELVQPPLSELIVLPGSRLIGRTLKGLRFAERYKAVVIGLHRPGAHLSERHGSVPIRAGDVLVVEGAPDALRALGESPGLLVVGAPTHPDERPDKLGVAVFTLAGVVLAVSLGLLPIVTAATAGCAVLIVTRCLRPREAYAAIDWSIIFLLAGALALGAALSKTGLTASLSQGLAALTGATGPLVILAVFLITASVLSEMMSNSGTAALLGPVAVATASAMNVNPMAMLAAVTLGSSASFATPIGYQTSLMIYGPGGYRFRDYLKMGIPLNVLLALIALWLIPIHWPLAPP